MKCAALTTNDHYACDVYYLNDKYFIMTNDNCHYSITCYTANTRHAELHLATALQGNPIKTMKRLNFHKIKRRFSEIFNEFLIDSSFHHLPIIGHVFLNVAVFFSLPHFIIENIILANSIITSVQL